MKNKNIESCTGTDSQTIYIPNKETQDAIDATLSGNVVVFDNIEDFFKDLDGS